MNNQLYCDPQGLIQPILPTMMHSTTLAQRHAHRLALASDRSRFVRVTEHRPGGYVIRTVKVEDAIARALKETAEFKP